MLKTSRFALKDFGTEDFGFLGSLDFSFELSGFGTLNFMGILLKI